MFGLLRYDVKANGKEPERQKERTPEHARIQNQIAANASEIFRGRDAALRRLVGAARRRYLIRPSEAKALRQTKELCVFA